MVIVVALALGVATTGSGCPGARRPDTLNLPTITTDNPAAEAEMRAAREAFDAGNADEATQRYEAFLARHPSDPLTVVAHLALGQISLARRNVDGARSHFEVVTSHREASMAERGRFYMGVTEALAGNHVRALEELRPFVGRTVDPNETALLFRTMAASSNALGDRVGALSALDLLLGAAVPEEEKVAARESLDQTIPAATPDEIQRATDALPRGGAVWPLVAQRAMREAYERGDLSRVQQLASALETRGIELDDELQAMALRAERSQQADPRAIGAILPLSGRGQEVGQLALQGLMLASGTAAEGPAPPNAMRVVFRDDGGDPQRAADAVDELVSLHRVIAIVGPLGGPAAARASARAEELGVPLITLTPSTDGTAAGPRTFRLFVSPADEAQMLVAAARARGGQRFAILHPDNAYGQTMRSVFADAVRSIGAELGPVVSYPADATAFGPAVTELRRESFDTLFIPDTARRLSLIAPALAAGGLWSAPPGGTPPTNARPVGLVLPSVAFDPTLARSSGRYLQGALFSNPFHAATAEGRARAFADAFQARFGRTPDLYAASAFDALELVKQAVDRGATSRGELVDQLGRLGTTDTAGPSGGFAANREPARGTRLVELLGDGFTAVPLAAAAPAVPSSKPSPSRDSDREPPIENLRSRASTGRPQINR
jgi:ABC-type branched-subunit amino acid transport system substrate-binding protein